MAEQVEWYDPIPIAVPSYRRAKTCTTHRAVDGVTYFVRREEEEEYRKVLGDEVEIVAYEPKGDGSGPAKQFILEYYDWRVMILDDDVVAVIDCSTEPGEGRADVSPQTAWAIIQRDYDVACQIGAKMFALSLAASTTQWIEGRPFSLGGMVRGACVGIIGDRRLSFDFDRYGVKYVEDLLLSGLNAYYNRYVLLDRQYAVMVGKTFGAQGGNAVIAQRREEEMRDRQQLRRLFGSAVVAGKDAPRKRNDVTRYSTAWSGIKYTLQVPWWR